MTNEVCFRSPPNPFLEDGKWHWYDESYNIYGPYDTSEEALAALKLYCNVALLQEWEADNDKG